MAKAAKRPGKGKSRTPRRSAKPAPPDPTALTPAEAARMLRVPPETIAKHLEAGAPAGPKGRINLVHYAAWLNRRIADGY